MQLKLCQSNTLYSPIQVLLRRKTVDTLSLIDSGAGLDLIDKTLIKDWNLPRRKLKKPLAIWNGDRSINKNKKITDYVKLDAIIDQQQIKLKLTIADLGQPQIILGIPWLKKYNPIIDQKKGMMKWRNTELTKNFSELLDSQGENPWIMNHEIYELNTKISALQVLAQKGKQKDNQITKQMVPEEYHEYLLLFDEKKSEQFPPAKTQDHKIEMKPTFEPKAFKPYKFSFAEIKEQENFVKENL